MSVFKDATSWSGKHKACGAPHQSPVNLSRSFALPCERLCELTIDKVHVTKGSVYYNYEIGALTLALGGPESPGPSVKFNGVGYTANFLYLFTPGQHTIENVRAEAELVFKFSNPKGHILFISFAVRTLAGESESTSFFNKFVPFFVPRQQSTVSFRDNWGLHTIIPENRGYYVYEGTSLTPPCTPDSTWVVFSSAINIDPSDFAKLVSNVPSGSRPLQEVGDREVFFNDGEKIEPGVPSDGKMYMKCRRIPRTGEISSSDAKSAIKQGNLIQKDKDATSANQKIAISNIEAKLGDAYTSLGGIWGIISVFTFAGIAFYLFSEKGSSISRSFFGILIMIPAYINRYTFALLLS